jgi:hypothetical protein
MKHRCVGLPVVILAVFALVVIILGRDAVALERTRAADQLPGAALDVGKSRKQFAAVIFDYCTQTANHLPRNTQKEDNDLAADVASYDTVRMKRAAESIQFSRNQLQKALTECALISKSILDDPTKRATAEAALWVRLEGSFDLDGVTSTAANVGVYRENENHETLSDLHG